MIRTIKNALMLTVAATLFTSATYAVTGCYHVVRSGTKPWGVRDLAQNDDDGIHSLFCTGEGEKICQFKDGTCPDDIGLNLGQVDQDVRTQIEIGNLDGSSVFPAGTYTWSGTDVSNYSFQMFIEE